MIKFVLIDLDDTILDFHAAEAVAIRDTLRQFGIDPNDGVIATYSKINRRMWQMLEQGEATRAEILVNRFALLFNSLGVVGDPAQAELTYEHELSKAYWFVEGAPEFLEELTRRGYRLYLASNGTTAVQTGRIKGSGIEKYFEKVFLSEEIGAVKPQAEYFDACFAAVPEMKREQTIIVGDTFSSDILGGFNAGIYTCWFNPKGRSAVGDRRPDGEITKLSQFFQLLEKLDQTVDNS